MHVPIFARIVGDVWIVLVEVLWYPCPIRASVAQLRRKSHMGSLSLVHWLIVIIVVLLLFGSGRIPGMVKGLGEGIREFKKGISDDRNEAKPAPKQLETKAEAEPAAQPEGKPKE